MRWKRGGAAPTARMAAEQDETVQLTTNQGGIRGAKNERKLYKMVFLYRVPKLRLIVEIVFILCPGREGKPYM